MFHYNEENLCAGYCDSSLEAETLCKNYDYQLQFIYKEVKKLQTANNKLDNFTDEQEQEAMVLLSSHACKLIHGYNVVELIKELAGFHVEIREKIQG